MEQIVLFNNIEHEIINIIKTILEIYHDRKGLEKVDTNEMALKELAQSISLYPSILGTQYLGKTSRSVNTLVENLCLKEKMDLTLQIPTKAILGKSFTIAKINFFFMLLYLTRDKFNEQETYEDVILNLIYNNTITLMAEEVFLSIIADRNISLHVRTNAGYMLVNLWEYRIDHGVREFAPILSSIWDARKGLSPAFGTMMGTTELFKLSSKADPRWLEYIKRDEIDQDEIDSVYEFLMALSFEEMNQLHEKMEQSGKSLLKENEIDEMLNHSKNYPFYETDDPRDLYNFFQMRHATALIRARSNYPGPKKTIEEYLMCYLLSFADDREELPYVLKKQKLKNNLHI